MGRKSGKAVEGVSTSGAVADPVVLDDLFFVIVCYVGELEFC